MYDDDDDLAMAEGVYTGLAIALAFWIVMLALAWMVL